MRSKIPIHCAMLPPEGNQLCTICQGKEILVNGVWQIDTESYRLLKNHYNRYFRLQCYLGLAAILLTKSLTTVIRKKLFLPSLMVAKVN